MANQKRLISKVPESEDEERKRLATEAQRDEEVIAHEEKIRELERLELEKERKKQQQQQQQRPKSKDQDQPSIEQPSQQFQEPERKDSGKSGNHQ